MAKYSARAGFINLQEEDTVTAVENLQQINGNVEVDHNLLRGAAESTRKRNASEVLKRLRNAPQSIWKEVPHLSSPERRIILYYLILKTHSFFFDFHMEVLLQKWLAMDTKFSKDDVLRFIERSMGSHPELENWSEESKRRTSRAVKLMLEQIGLLDNHSRLKPVSASKRVWHLWVREGEVWFLEAMLLNKTEREQIIG